MQTANKYAATMLIFGMLLGMRVSAADKIVHIGFAGPLSGLSSANGNSMLKAAQIAVDEANAMGIRVDGNKLVFKLLVQDDKSNTRIAEIAAQYFVKNGVVGVVGIFNSAVAVSASATYQKAGIAHFAVSGNRRFTQQGHNTAFRLVANDEQRANILVTYAVQEMKKTKIAIMHDDTVYGNGYRDQFVKAFKKVGGTVVSISPVSATTYDFNDFLKTIKASQAQAIFFGGLAAQTAMVAYNMHRLGVDLTLVTAASAVGPTFVELAGSGAEGVVSIASGHAQRKSKKMEDFEKKFRQKYDSAIEPFTAITYDGVHVLIAAIVQASSVEPRKVAAALHEVKFNGVTGPIAFDASGDLRDLALSVLQVKNASWTLLKQYRVGADN